MSKPSLSWHYYVPQRDKDVIQHISAQPLWIVWLREHNLEASSCWICDAFESALCLSQLSLKKKLRVKQSSNSKMLENLLVKLASLFYSFKLPDHLHLENLPEIEQADKELKASGKGDNLSQMGEWHDGSLTWDFVAWIRTQTSLPIFVKVHKQHHFLLPQHLHWHEYHKYCIEPRLKGSLFT